MKVSKYLFLTDYPSTKEQLLYNTLNGALISIDEKNQEELNTLIAKGTQIENATELTNFLAEESFLVDDNFDETQIVLERNSLGIKDENRLDVIIMPNMNCNFGCPYCYEDHHKSAMSDETQKRLLDWIKMMVPKFKSVLVSWFGGEPMMSYKTISYLQKEINKICEDADVPLATHITTNGYLFTDESVADLVGLGIYSYQITIDGSPETHNKTRILKNGKETFEKVFENTIKLARSNKTVNIKLRVNFDNSNIDEIPKMLEMFPVDVRKQLVLVLERIFGGNYGVYGEGANTSNLKVIEIYRLAEKLGFLTAEEDLQPKRLTYCYADRQNQFLFNYNGDVFKCTVGKFETKDRLGVINDKGKIEWEGNRLTNWHDVPAFEEKCMKCTFMPMCMGGCRQIRLLNGTVGDDCKLPYQNFENKVRAIYESQL